MKALHAFGLGSLGVEINDFTAAGNVLQLGFPPVRVDIVTSITGVSWGQAAAGRVEGPFGDLRVFYIGKREFVKNKQSLRRKKDLADLEAIGEG